MLQLPHGVCSANTEGRGKGCPAEGSTVLLSSEGDQSSLGNTGSQELEADSVGSLRP